MYKGFGSRRGRFEDASEDDVGTVRYAAGNPSGEMIDFASRLRHPTKTGAVLKSFAGVDRHDGEGQFCLQFVEYRFACACRHTADVALDDAAY